MNELQGKLCDAQSEIRATIYYQFTKGNLDGDLTLKLDGFVYKIVRGEINKLEGD